MKKMMITLAAVLCCAMTTMVFTACGSDDDDNGNDDWVHEVADAKDDAKGGGHDEVDHIKHRKLVASETGEGNACTNDKGDPDITIALNLDVSHVDETDKGGHRKRNDDHGDRHELRVNFAFLDGFIGQSHGNTYDKGDAKHDEKGENRVIGKSLENAGKWIH